MSDNFVKVKYSINENIKIFLFIFLLVIVDAFVIFIQPISIKNIIAFISIIIIILLSIYFQLNKIKKISLYNGELSISRFLLSSLTFEIKDIKVISKDELTIGKRLFSLKFVINKSELITLLINSMEIKNTDEEINRILFSGGAMSKNIEEMDKKNNEGEIINKTLYTIKIIIGIGFIAMLISSDCPIIIVIGFVILIGFGYLKDIIFDEKIYNINSKFLRVIIKCTSYLVVFVLAFALVIVIYRIFNIWDIDLLKITL